MKRILSITALSLGLVTIGISTSAFGECAPLKPMDVEGYCVGLLTSGGPNNSGTSGNPSPELYCESNVEGFANCSLGPQMPM